jgi:hypothetical protein
LTDGVGNRSWVSAIRNVQFRCNQLMRKIDQTVALNWRIEDRAQIAFRVTMVA